MPSLRCRYTRAPSGLMAVRPPQNRGLRESSRYVPGCFPGSSTCSPFSREGAIRRWQGLTCSATSSSRTYGSMPARQMECDYRWSMLFVSFLGHTASARWHEAYNLPASSVMSSIAWRECRIHHSALGWLLQAASMAFWAAGVSPVA